MKKKIIILLLLIFVPLFKVKAMDINYQAHVQQKSWMNVVSNGETAGTSGQTLRMEAIKINISSSAYTGNIEYQVHVQQKGWMSWVKNGEIAGTTGQGLRMEAIRIKLSGNVSNYYDVEYRTHVRFRGWMSWVKNGEIAGTTGQGLQMEAIEIKLVPKNDNPILYYSSHNVDGWQNYYGSGEVSGTTGQRKQIDQIKIKIDNTDQDISYQTYTKDLDWSSVIKNDEVSGELEKGIEAIKIDISDELKKEYNIYYRVHIQTYGWLSWTSNGKEAGSTDLGKKIEAFQIKLLKKDSKEITPNDTGAFIRADAKVKYSSHVQQKGWMSTVSNGEISGTTGQGLRLEAYKINVESKIPGDIVYKTFVSRRTWTGESKNGEVSGTTGLGRPIEAIQIRLTGELSNYYDVYYKVHSSHVGWSSWAKNGGKAGTLNSDLKIEAIQVKLVLKVDAFTEDTSRPYRNGHWNGTSYVDCIGRIVTGFRLIDGVKYFFNPEGKQYGKHVQKIIDVSSWQGTIDWETIKKNEDVDAAIIRVGWGTSYNDPCGLDSYYDRNVREVQRLGIPYGVYIYAYAETVSAAQKEADYVVSKMKQYNIPSNTWVWYDAEIKSISRNTYNTVIPAFINRVKSQGYNNVGVYSGVSQLDTTNGNTNTPTIRSYPIWVSQYYKDLQYTGTYKGWQFASDEQVAGISGDVDCSMFFK